MEKLLKYDHVDISYLGQPAIRDVSFTLAPGEILGIVGESGSGKSTLIKAAMGLLGSEGCVTRGDIWYKGKNLPDLSPKELRRLNGPELGYIFQSSGSAFCPIRTVGAQLYETMKEHGKISKADFEAKALELLSKLGFDDGKRILASYPFELSGCDHPEAGGGGNADGAGHLWHGDRSGCPQFGGHRCYGGQCAGAEGWRVRGVWKDARGSV